jgi:hypothetical protein
MRRGENRIQVVDLGMGRCRVDADARIELEPSQAWRLLAAIPDLSRLTHTLDDLKVFAETGRPSERKRSARIARHPASYALWANALFSAATGLLLALDVGSISAVVRVPELASRAVGVGLLVFAGFVARAGLRVRAWQVIAISLADVCWVVLSIVAIAIEPTRLLWVGGTADVVLVVAALQIWGLATARRRAWSDSESRGT